MNTTKTLVRGINSKGLERTVSAERRDYGSHTVFMVGGQGYTLNVQTGRFARRSHKAGVRPLLTEAYEVNC